jgi:hypothetical protein
MVDCLAAYSMYQDYKDKYPSFNGTYAKRYQNTSDNRCNNSQSNSISFTTTNQLEVQKKKQEMSTGAKVAIGAGIVTALAVGADFLFCKGKHIKSICSKTGHKVSENSSPAKPNVHVTNTTTQPQTLNTSATNTRNTAPTGHSFHLGKAQNPQKIYHYNLYNRTAEDLKHECDMFKQMTGAELHVPDTMASENFGVACQTLERCAKDGNFPSDIKHVLVGHGYGSSVRGDWSMIGRGGNVFNYINHNPNIKNGDKVLVLCCESGEKVSGKRAIGDIVDLSLIDSSHPAKVVVAGENRIAGELYIPRLLEDNTLPVMYMYPDKPLFKIPKK